MPDHRELIPLDAGQRLAATLEQLFTTLAGRGSATFREAKTAEDLASLPGPLAVLTFRLSRGASGPALLVMPGAAGVALAQILLGQPGAETPPSPGPEEEDALRELSNQVAGAVVAALGALLGSPVGFEAPAVAWLPAGGRDLQAGADAAVLLIGAVAGAVTTDLYLVLPRTLLAAPAGGRVEPLPPLPDTPPPRNGSGIEMLLDISLPVTVELGRTRMMIRDILHLAPGSVLELDKLAGEPVDILINDKSIARGEVVVIDENFGVRLTSIITPSERLMNLR